MCDQLEDVGFGTWQNCDFVWLELDCCPDDPEVWKRVMPYDGAHLYPVETAEYLVSMGIIRAETIAKGLTASYHLDPKDLEGAWNQISRGA